MLFKNVSYNGLNLLPSVISGLDSTHTIKNIRFENLRINDKLILDAGMGNIKVGDFSSDVTFSK